VAARPPTLALDAAGICISNSQRIRRRKWNRRPGRLLLNRSRSKCQPPLGAGNT
jgi:hypothetical protein